MELKKVLELYLDHTVVEAAVEVLKGLGMEIVDFDDEKVEFNIDGNSATLEISEIEIGMTCEQVFDRCDLQSGCCGYPLNKDIMICPSCKEHC